MRDIISKTNKIQGSFKVMIFLVNETDAKITELVLFEKGLNVNTVLRFSYSLGFSKTTRVVY